MKQLSVAFTGALVLLSGCESMQSVKDYSSYSKSTIESVNPIAKDYFASCLRSNSYKPLASYSKCTSEKEAATAILTVAGVLDSYGAALGALASDELVDYSADVDKLTGEVKNLKSFDEKKVDALGKLSAFIAGAATKAYQQKQVVKFVQDSNDAVVSVANGLADAIDANYSEAIKLELSAWEDGYKRVERVDRDSRPLDWEAYSKAQWQNRVDLEAKLSAAKALSRGIRAIGETHSKLERDAEKITGKEVYASVRSFVEAAKPIIKEVREAYANN